MKPFIVDQQTIEWGEIEALGLFLNAIVNCGYASSDFGPNSPESLEAEKVYEKVSKGYFSKYPLDKS